MLTHLAGVRFGIERIEENWWSFVALVEVLPKRFCRLVSCGRWHCEEFIFIWPLRCKTDVSRQKSL